MNTFVSSLATNSIIKIQGRVAKIDKENSFIVDCELGLVCANKAFSCLIEPHLQDQVILLKSDDKYFITDILARPSASPIELSVPCELKVNLKNNDFSIQSANKMTVASDTSEFIFRKANLTTDEANIKGGQLKQSWKRIFTTSHQLWCFARNKVERLTSSLRQVSGKDHQHSGSYSHEVDNRLKIHAKSSVFTAKKDVIIDGKRINMG